MPSILWYLYDEAGRLYTVLLQSLPISGCTGRVLPAGATYEDAGAWIPMPGSELYWRWERYTDDGYCGALQAAGQLLRQGVRIVRFERKPLEPAGSVRDPFLLKTMPTLEQVDAVASLWAGTAMPVGASAPLPWTPVPGMWFARTPDYEDDTGTEPLAKVMHLQVCVRRTGPRKGELGVCDTLNRLSRQGWLADMPVGAEPLWLVPMSPAGPITLQELAALVEARRAKLADS